MSENSFVKDQMKELWKENFHDSDEYVDLIFDAYFNLDMVEYEVRDDKVVAALMGVPYKFGNAKNSIKGIYLCGLSTAPDYRRNGIMGALMERFAKRVNRDKYSFLFLIPANDGLQKYYKDRGFVDAFYKVQQHYVSNHNFKREFDNSIQNDPKELQDLKCKRFDTLNVIFVSKSDTISNADNITKIDESLINDVCIFINSREQNRDGMQLIHSVEDCSTAVRECLVSDGRLYAVRDAENKITAVALLYEDKEEKNVRLYYMVSDDDESGYKMLEKIKRDFEECSLTVMKYPVRAESATGLWQPFFGAALPEAPAAGAVGEMERGYFPVAHSEVYGMARILNVYEILKFQAGERHDLKYSILAKEGSDPRFMQYKCKNGLVERVDLTDKLSDKEKRQVLMTERDIAEILFRRPDSDPIVEEVMELPPLGGAISMMLD